MVVSRIASVVKLVSRWVEEDEVLLLRLGIATVFLWFGLIKILDYENNPIRPLVEAFSPYLASGLGFYLLGGFEVLVGMGFLFGRYLKYIAILLILHMGGTFLTILFVPSRIFGDYFPLLTLEGEFVVKNLVLVACALAIIAHSLRPSKGKLASQADARNPA